MVTGALGLLGMAVATAIAATALAIEPTTMPTPAPTLSGFDETIHPPHHALRPAHTPAPHHRRALAPAHHKRPDPAPAETAATRPAPDPTARAAQDSIARPAPSPTAPPPPAATQATPAPAPAPTYVALAPAAPLPATPALTPLLALILVAAGAFGGWGLGRATRRPTTAADPAPTPQPAPPAAAPPERPQPTTDFASLLPPEAATPARAAPAHAAPTHAAFVPAPPPPPVFDPADLTLDFHPQRCTLTLATATLRYAVIATNTGAAPAPPLAIGLEIAAAGAAATPTRPAPGPGSPVSQHRLDGLDPGAQTELRGQLTLTLGPDSALDLAGARLLLLLVRLRMGLIPAEALAATPSGAPLPPVRVKRTLAFLVGAAADGPATRDHPDAPAHDAVTPLRLDLAPASWDKLAARPVDPVPPAPAPAGAPALARAEPFQ